MAFVNVVSHVTKAIGFIINKKGWQKINNHNFARDDHKEMFVKQNKGKAL